MKDTGDKSPRKMPSAGASVPMGLASQEKITESPEKLGMGIAGASQRPVGPQKGSMGGQRVA